MKVPFVDLKAQYLSIKGEIDVAIRSVIEETAFIGGKYVDSFERDFGNLYGVDHVVSCANGTDSLYIIMKMLGIGSGDEVITVANSWISSSETISQTGATPVFVDIDPNFYSIDELLLEGAITSRTRAVIAVHLHGQMCEIELIKGICDKHGLYLIEDCAQSHFSEFKGKRAGLFGIAGSFSFYPGKNLGAYGDAGCIISNNSSFADKCRMFSRHGALKKHQHQIEGINSRLDGIQAAILSAKLPHILNWTSMRIYNASLYNKYLSDIPQVLIPRCRPDSVHTYHLYVIRVKKRDELMEFLTKSGIETSIHYPTALPNLPAYKYLGKNPDDYPVASSMQSEILSLPMYPELTEDQIQYVARTIQEFYA
ncbi:DegT/DnrJ/EryC1/StrS family aminotransferase [Flavihumibacter rivuli]|uniref:DegT/DnrJ/EryC1/StrS family aminotransferase n=1 Tax=Flavihumibacter rivuli TaxID=2838156 RepID=UPI001BDEFFA1|nr:DegT/DnrJ/EryC1/StrS family aminotransferase [Flavihumibacter rivuli]ULQ56260.1 DegT/DnrJ/EryC1/StrS family aminotransferase [Flavihumibacter rivuli]